MLPDHLGVRLTCSPARSPRKHVRIRPHEWRNDTLDGIAVASSYREMGGGRNRRRKYQRLSI